MMWLRSAAWDAGLGAGILASRGAPRDVRSVLAVQTAGVGNTILFTPALAALRRAFPGARSTVVASRSGAAVVEGGALADEVIVADPGVWLGGEPYRALLARVAGRPFDVAVSAQAGYRPADLLYRSGARARVGFRYALGRRRATAYKLTAAVRRDDARHEALQYLDLAAAAGADPTGVGLHVAISEADRRAAGDFLASHGTPPRVTAIHAGSDPALAGKRWPIERFAALAETLAARGYFPVFVGGPGEVDLGKSVARLVRVPHASAIGRLTLGATAALVEAARVCVTNDSAVLHVACAVGTPVVALFGPTRVAKNGPWRMGARARVVRKELACSPCYVPHSGRIDCGIEHLCMGMIGVDEVAEAAESVAAQPRVGEEAIA